MPNPFYTFPISEHLEQTPEGFLICRDVPIAMAGAFDYAQFETPPGLETVDGKISIERLPEDIFRPDTIASAEGKPVVFIRHPPREMDGGFVTPETAKMFTVGHAQNVRAGQNGSGNKLLADLFITDRETIDAILARDIREVSPGFGSSYQQEQPGKARNLDILFNHVALVRQGRAGAELAIQDAKPAEVKMTILDGLKKVFGKTLDAPMPAEEPKKEAGDPLAAIQAVVAENAEMKTKMDGIVSALAEIKANFEKLLADEDAEKALMEKAAADVEAAKVADPAAVAPVDPAKAEQDMCATHDSAVISAAEIVAPGCNVKDKALVKTALATGLKGDAREAVEYMLGGVMLDALDDKAALIVLRGAAGKLTEARKTAAHATAVLDSKTSGPLLTDPRAHNEFFSKHYGK